MLVVKSFARAGISWIIYGSNWFNFPSGFTLERVYSSAQMPVLTWARTADGYAVVGPTPPKTSLKTRSEVALISWQVD